MRWRGTYPLLVVFAISTRRGGYALRRPISTRQGEYAPPRCVVAISIRRGGVRPSTSCCLCHSDTTRRVHPFSLYRSCYFNMPGWGIPFQCWERTPPFTPAQLSPSLRPSVLALGFLPYPQLSTLGGICPPHPFNTAWRDLPPRCIVVPSITTTPLPSKPSTHARFRWQLVPFYNCYPTTIKNEQALLVFDGGLLFYILNNILQLYNWFISKIIWKPMGNPWVNPYP